MRELERTTQLYERARRHLAGGVSSDARRGVQPVPLFIDRAQGAYLWDVDGNHYIDYVLGQGPMLLGHTYAPVIDAVKRQLDRGQAYSAQHILEAEVAEAICRMVPCAELVRFNSVGSEAVHAAWRLARAYTGREKILKFEGHYHGWLDPALYSLQPDPTIAGPEEAPFTIPVTRGQPRSSVNDIVVAPWNNLDALAALLDRYGSDVAAVVMEPILCNSGCIAPIEGFLSGVQALCHKHGCLIIFDEIITGFRLGPGGAQDYLSFTPDLAVFGKAIANGFALSCLAGRAEIMDLISRGEVGHAGTFNSNPVVMAAAAATLDLLERDGSAIYGRIYAAGQRLMAGLRAAAAAANVPLLVDGPGPLFQIYFTDQPAVRTYRDFAACDRQRMARLHAALLSRGINMVARGLWFLSAAHSDADIDHTVMIFADALDATR